MDIAVLGGGLQGCCIALSLAARGARVVLFDGNDSLLSRAAIANEGKIHLGYVYAADSSLATARMMLRGALAFAPFLRRHLGFDPERIGRSGPTTYLVHRDSQLNLEQVSRYLTAHQALLAEAAAGRDGDYFGLDLRPPPLLRPGGCAAEYDPEFVRGIFNTQEIAIEPEELAKVIRDRIAATDGIEVRLGWRVGGVTEDGLKLRVRRDGVEKYPRHGFDHVVNALWDGRLAVDATLGLLPRRPWLYRFKYGIQFQLPSGEPALPTVTLILGPFGEIVTYASGAVYLTWYPVCMRGLTEALIPPDWPMYPGDPLRTEIAEGTLRALAEIVPPLRCIHLDRMSDLKVKGGVIVAFGSTDIVDPHSELHHRREIGIVTRGRYHSVDPGKLTMAPYFAGMCAERILG
jgi:hypothetical protein